MIKIKIFSVGKASESWLDVAIEEFQKRLTGQVSLELLLVKTDEQLVSLVEKETCLICLDPRGKMQDSEQFAKALQKKIENSGARLAFVIGGADGLPAILKENYELWSLSPLTFTHQLTRLLLVEQIYRAMTILRGSPYHK